jgi:hypothetical protein
MSETNPNVFYLPAFTANRELNADMIFEYFNKSDVLPYICYHITNSGPNPFLQIMLQKTPFCNNVIKEEFVLPSVLFKRTCDDIGDLIVADVKQGLQRMNLNLNANPNANPNTKIVFKGILVDANNNCYGLVDLSNIELKYLEQKRNTPLWFVLPTEIVNLQSICNIPVSDKVVDLFTYRKPELCILQNTETDEYYSAPDVGYTSADYKTSELQLVFGPSKTLIDESESHGYIFYNSFFYALKNESKNPDKERKIGINRYAIFSESNSFSFDTINVDTVNIKQFEMFFPLSIYSD